jgi:hypothetical protein
VIAGSEKIAEMGGGFGKDIRGGNADYLEAFALAVGDEKGFGLARIVDQKSRSA